MEQLSFQGIEYPIVMVNFPFGERKISTVALNNALMNFNGSYVSDIAIRIDEEIFSFVEEEALYFEEKKLVEMIISEI